MPRRRVLLQPRRRRTRTLRGRGFFGDLWSGIKRVATKPSTWLSLGSRIAPGPLRIPLGLAGAASGLAGHGRRRRRVRRVRGRGLLSDLLGGLGRRRAPRRAPRRRRRMQGGSLLGMLSPGYVLKKVLSKLHDHVKKNKYVSRTIRHVGNSFGDFGGAVGNRLGDFAQAHGYGRRRRPSIRRGGRRSMYGAGLYQVNPATPLQQVIRPRFM